MRVSYRGREILTNPPPNAGGTLLAMAMELLEESVGVPDAVALAHVMEVVQGQRTPEFVSKLGSTTHISVLDGDGRACSVTCTNGEGSGIWIPGTGIHVNNIMGEEDLNPLGLPRVPARAADALDDGADRRASDPPASSWSSAAPAPTGSARRSCRRSSA